MMFAEEHSLILPAVPDLVWGTVSFIVVAFVVYKIAWPAFIRTLDERHDKIDAGLHAAEKAREEIASERAALSSQVDDARKEAARIREQAQSNAADIVAAAQKRAEAEAQRIAETSKRQIEADAQSAQRTLQAKIGVVAIDLAQRIVGEQVLDPTVSQNVVDGFLDQLEAENAGIKEQ
ncbi:MAG: F0F1 ATP synthase subunit B [Ancrocorticia sp.]|jgi:F-type H+-transporting ATPase subunit b|nr:F0F1 ATP synthase subunit B [Ancrocorticia sp.]MCI1895997.1 F0F1 ATP synthase subunit B [Ancrocorticia sp.]MCI1932439.1 F0F1 ATP synthase subunit B [Ancrocorticia sp.]MCI1964127.1 F0F1 ATP synthase subunit B [Ancrocorticia sp.]MCI2002564.1 F0F1 ATP synthase subunit B [Ancrocorticia sp.]